MYNKRSGQLIKAAIFTFAALFSTAGMAQDAGVLYRTSIDIGSTDFSVYDIASDTWTTLTPFNTNAQMATSTDGRLFALNATANEIQEYDPGTDTWSFIQVAPPTSIQSLGNLEYRANGEWTYSGSNSNTLYYTVAGVWQTLVLPFNANAIGDYDPATDTLVLGQFQTSYFHAVDMSTLTITPFTQDDLGQGEWSRCGQIRNGLIYYQTDSNPLRYQDLANNAAAPVDVVPSLGFYPSCAVSESTQDMFVNSLSGNTLTRVSLVDSTTTPLAGHTALGNHSSVSWVGEAVPVEPGSNATFKVTKTFSDDITDSVDVTLTCNGGLPLEQSFTIDGGDLAGVTFVLTNFIDGVTNCEVTETGGPAGYTPVYNGGSGCSWTGVTASFYQCAISNEADDGEFTVNMNWIVGMEGGDAVDQDIPVYIQCDAMIEPYTDSDDDYWYYETSLGDGESATVSVDTTEGTAECRAEQDVDDASGVETSDDCGWQDVSAAEEVSCTFDNTVFFEGIPTLSQYGLALMALLMLGMGMVGFRRFT